MMVATFDNPYRKHTDEITTIVCSTTPSDTDDSGRRQTPIARDPLRCSVVMILDHHGNK
jgi:hypothetical protein